MSRPCRFCVAQWEGFGRRSGVETTVKVNATDCEWSHRDDPRIYALAEAIARVLADRKPSDEQISWYLGDADDVVDDFDPAPERWKVRRLPESANDGEQGIEIRLRINDVTYVGLEGGKDSRGNMVRLATFRSWGHT